MARLPEVVALELRYYAGFGALGVNSVKAMQQSEWTQYITRYIRHLFLAMVCSGMQFTVSHESYLYASV